jgi:DNA (cytosine-5)-methyltransferase 1
LTAYYNEIDPYCAQWLRNLIDADLIASGDVDERSIVDVRADDLRGYTQCHFFAGIGGWSLALRLAGWPDDRPVWTGSCPCQPFSAAGAGKAADDERHLWPAWASLIRECRPGIIFGEQVEAAIGWGWLDAVFNDLEAEKYACASAVLPACGVGAPHIRQRLWFMADHAIGGRGKERADAGRVAAGNRAEGIAAGPEPSGQLGEGLDDAAGARRNRSIEGPEGFARDQAWLRLPDAGSGTGGTVAIAEGEQHDRSRNEGRWWRQSANGGGMGNADQPGPQGRWIGGNGSDQRSARSAGLDFWSDAEFIACTDGKARPVEPGTFPLAHGIPGRVGRLRAYGNAIVPQAAAAFIIAATED